MSYAERLRAALSPADGAVVSRLAQLAACPLYLVGGPVRDCLLGRRVTRSGLGDRRRRDRAGACADE